MNQVGGVLHGLRLAAQHEQDVLVVGQRAVDVLVHLLHDDLLLLLADVVVQEGVDLPDHVVGADADVAQVEGLVQPEVLRKLDTQ